MKETFTNIKKVYKYGKEFKLCLIIQAICCLFGIFVNIIIPFLTAKFEYEFTNNLLDSALIILSVIFVIKVADSVKMFIIRKNTQVFRRGTVRNIQMVLGRKILRLEQSIIDSNSSGTFIQRIVNDTDKMSGVFTVGMGRLTRLLSILGAFVAVLFIDYRMFLYFLFAASLLTALNYVKTENVKVYDKKYRKQSDKVAGLTTELVRGVKDIKMLYASESFINVLDDNILEQNELNFKARNVDMTWNLVLQILESIFLLIAVILLFVFVKNKSLSILSAFTILLYRSKLLTDLMETISLLFEDLKDFNISSNRVFEIIDGNNFKMEEFGNQSIDKVVGDIELKNVCFSYDGVNSVLNKVNIKIKHNHTYGIVGKSGEGKSTIFNLLGKLYDCDDGVIKIDGIDIKTLDEKSIRGNITLISQNPYIFNMSIKDNLKLVKNNISDEEIRMACKVACLDEFIDSLPCGYDTVVGEGGIALSGGQRQRIAIARALIQKTKIILFDEATSALDNETQSKIQEAINGLKDSYTIVIIAHRLSTIINCDRIFFIENGKIESSGKHEELLKKSRSYKNLYEFEIKNKE